MSAPSGRSGKPGPGPEGAEASPSSSLERSLEDAWQTAEQRAMLYLKSLHVPPKKSLEYALKALVAAEHGPSGDPPADTMRTLRAILKGERVFPDDSEVLLSPQGRAVPAVRVSPPVSRGVMVPGELDRRPWVAATARFLRAVKALPGRVFARRKP